MLTKDTLTAAADMTAEVPVAGLYQERAEVQNTFLATAQRLLNLALHKEVLDKVLESPPLHGSITRVELADIGQQIRQTGSPVFNTLANVLAGAVGADVEASFKGNSQAGTVTLTFKAEAAAETGPAPAACKDVDGSECGCVGECSCGRSAEATVTQTELPLGEPVPACAQ